MVERIKNLKRWQKILCIVLAVVIALVAFFNIWAAVEGRSTRSLLLEKVLGMIPVGDRQDPEYFNQALEDTSRPYELPDSVRKKHGFTEYDTYTDTFTVNYQNDTSDLVIFYLHGGGYWVDPIFLHYDFFNKMAKNFNAEFILPIYPKAPAHTATEVHEMIMERYLYLINDKGISSDNIVIMGDSAGGGLALALMQVLRDEGIPMPRQAVLFSPWVDVTNSSPGMHEVRDPFKNVDNLAYGGKIYAGDLDTKNPLVSPIYGSLLDLPPITVFSGTYDALHVDVEKMAEIAKQKGIDFTLYTYEKMIHGFIGFTFLPEAKEAFVTLTDAVLNQR